MPLVACFRDVAQWFGLKYGAPNTIFKRVTFAFGGQR
jgi:hypothetical protein